MDDTASIISGSLAETTASIGTKRKRGNEVKFYAVRVGHQPGVYHTWNDCLDQVKGFKKATCEFGSCFHRPRSLTPTFLVKSFSSLADAERFVAGENPAQGGSNASSPPAKFYAVKSGRVPGIYMDWPSAQEQITGWQKPKHRCFTTRFEAQRFLDEDKDRPTETLGTIDGDTNSPITLHAPGGLLKSDVPPPAHKKPKTITNVAKSTIPAINEAEFDPGTGPMPPDAEDGFDPSIILDPKTGTIVNKTQEQRQATKSKSFAGGPTDPIRIHTDGSSLGNGKAGAFAGVGVYFGPSDERQVDERVVDFEYYSVLSQERVGNPPWIPTDQPAR
jgi:ribonuclease HI